MTNFVLPEWIDQVRDVDFEPEKNLLTDMETWARNNGWEVNDGRSLSLELRRRTDILLVQPQRKRHLRIAVLPKTKKGPGVIRMDASNHRVFELIYQPRTRLWRVETAAVPLSEASEKVDWAWLFNLAFRP